MTKDRVTKLGGFMKLLFSHPRDEIWKEVMVGLRFLGEMTGDLSLVEDLIKNLVENANEAEKLKFSEIEQENQESD